MRFLVLILPVCLAACSVGEQNMVDVAVNSFGDDVATNELSRMIIIDNQAALQTEGLVDDLTAASSVTPPVDNSSSDESANRR